MVSCALRARRASLLTTLCLCLCDSARFLRLEPTLASLQTTRLELQKSNFIWGLIYRWRSLNIDIILNRDSCKRVDCVAVSLIRTWLRLQYGCDVSDSGTYFESQVLHCECTGPKSRSIVPSSCLSGGQFCIYFDEGDQTGSQTGPNPKKGAVEP